MAAYKKEVRLCGNCHNRYLHIIKEKKVARSRYTFITCTNCGHEKRLHIG